MESILNHSAIENYSITFSKNLISEFFSEQNRITGNELLNFFEVKQVNLFILKHLFENWQLESQNMRSPYFDYEHEDVKRALNEYMNLLSKHISIKKKDFEPLLIKAVQDTIMLICSPYDYFHEIFKRNGSKKIKLSSMQKNERYMKINKHLYQAFVDKIESTGKSEINGEKAIGYLNEVIENLSRPPEDFEEYEFQFSKVAKLDVNKFYEEATEAPVPVLNSEEEKQRTVNEKFSADSKTLLDEISGNDKTSLAQIHQNKKIQSIKKHISINQRFMFVNELFGGNTDLFNATIDNLENMSSYEDAIDFLVKNHARENEWVMESEEVIEFLEVLEKRFN